MRLIDADLFKKDLQDEADGYGYYGYGYDEWDSYNKAYTNAIKLLDEQPTVELEIIRCKDCKYMTEHYDTDGNVPYWICSEWDSATDYDGFCHYAERRN